MKAADLYRLMDDPTLLSEATLPELKHIVDEYPYFQTARMLYLKNLAVLSDIRFGAELKKMSVCIADRRRLFVLIEGEQYGLQLKKMEHSPEEMGDTFSLIDAFLSSHADEGERKPEASLLFQPSASSDYIYWSLTKADGETPSGEKETVRLQHHELIDSFIENDGQRAPGSGLNLAAGASEAKPPASVAEMEAQPAKSLDDSYFTETLAHIYVKQKRYEKALQIIQNLNLKYPEKNAYFADQIRFLEKLIINTKK